MTIHKAAIALCNAMKNSTKEEVQDVGICVIIVTPDGTKTAITGEYNQYTALQMELALGIAQRKFKTVAKNTGIY